MDTAVLGVLGGICIVVGVVGAFFTAGATLPIAGVGCVLGGAAISSHSYTKTLDSDRSAGRDRSWSQFYLERTVKELLRNFRGQQQEPQYLQGCLPERI